MRRRDFVTCLAAAGRGLAAARDGQPAPARRRPDGVDAADAWAQARIAAFRDGLGRLGWTDGAARALGLAITPKSHVLANELIE